MKARLEALEYLKKEGYYVDNLWHIDDVKQSYNCTDEQAQEILDKAMTNGWITEQVFVAIDDIADVELTKNQKA